MDQYIGKMLDNRYEILECIGIGGMAVVYKSRDHRLNRLVAVKILKPELANDADFRRRFHDESQAVAMLSHINIVSVYDVSHSDGLDYIVMELVDGMTLKQYMQKRGTPLNWREALHFMTQILRALGHAHSRGIVHRDIKPQNILVLRDGSVKVADFGIARLTSAAQATLTQEALGSVHYISPEQAKGSQVDGRSDLYSAGVVLYEMLTGRLPFEGETPVFVAIQHINSIPIPPRELNPEIPPALEAIILKAMAPDPNNRYRSAEAMLADIKEFRKNPDGTGQSADFQGEVEEPTVVVSLSDLSGKERRPGDAVSRDESRKRPSKNQPRPQQAEGDRPHRSRAQKEREASYDVDSASRRKGVPPILVAVLAILVFAGGILYFVITLFSQDTPNNPEQLKVPNLLGYTLEELEADPSLLGDFTVEVGATVYNEEYEEGEICGQTPEGETAVGRDSTVITVTICGAPEDIYMPSDLVGKLATDVIAQLQDMGLKVRQEREYSPTISDGYVMECTPEAGTRLEEGDEVTIVISRGAEEEPPVTVTNFVGLPIEQVRDQVTGLGLTVGTVNEYYNDEYEEGLVIWQSVSATTQVDAGTVINFQVSKGKRPQPSAEPEPTVSGALPEPSQDANVPSGTATVTVDLTPYDETVSVRILVGSQEVYDNAVNAADIHTLRQPVTGTGIQTVSIYINDQLMRSYQLNFNA